MTSMLHRFSDDDPFEHRVRVADLAYVSTSKAAMTTLAENYVGLPFEV
jgi:p-hydroxybenzoate 3-monooxygenase